jgi:hypothetical protein
MLPSKPPLISGAIMAMLDGLQDKIPIIVASFSGAVLSVVIRGDKSVWAGFGNFLSGLVVGIYGGSLLAAHTGISDVAGSVIMALIGRQITAWLTGISIKDVISYFAKGKSP